MIACAVVPLTHQHLAFPRDSVQWRFSVRAGGGTSTLRSYKAVNIFTDLGT